MVLYKNTNIDVLDPEGISDSIIRKHKDNYIIGIVTEVSEFLHKKMRYRVGGLFCEEVFGLSYLCKNKKCRIPVEFNSNPISNKVCIHCRKCMSVNFKRKYRFGALFLFLPVINYYYYSNFINLLKIFDKIRKNYLYRDNLFKVSKTSSIKNIIFSSVVDENKLINFINSFYKFTKSLETIKIRLDLMTNYKLIKYISLNKCYKFLNNLSFIKKIFLVLFPVLPASLRHCAFGNKNFFETSKITNLYKVIIKLNNALCGIFECKYDLKDILVLHFIIESILNFSNETNVFGHSVDMYDKLYGKYGVFRQNLLGFRVDYSGRATIIPGASLSIDNIGLPFNMACNYVTEEFNKEGLLESEENVTNLHESFIYKNHIFDKLEYFNNLFLDYSIIINRAPTLHKMNVQSFNPVLVEGESIKFSPLLCAGYNADFDGDQMGAFSVLKHNTIYESTYMLKSLVNLYSPTTKKPIINLTQGMASGYYTLSNYNQIQFTDNYIASNYIDLIEYYSFKRTINCPVLLRSLKSFYFTTCGRILIDFNII